MATEAPVMGRKFHRSRSRNTSLGLRHIGSKARLKLSHTKETAEPRIITQSKSILKATKRTTITIKRCAESLYAAQSEMHRIERQLSTQLCSIQIENDSDHFGIFCNNMGRIHSSMSEIYQMYLLDVQHQLINPMHEFNQNEIAKCQQIKLKLETMKAEHDIINAKEQKIKKMLDERFPTDSNMKKKSNKSRHHRSKSAIKKDELQSIRNEFVKCFTIMNAKKMQILQCIKAYIGSFEVYAFMHWEEIKQNKENMRNRKIMNAENGRFWSRNAMILKEGFFEKQEKKMTWKRQWFKLYKSKKLLFMDDENGILKGFVDLNKIFDIGGKDNEMITIETMDKNGVCMVYTFRFESKEHRDLWLNVLEQAIASKTVSIKQIKEQYLVRNERLRRRVCG